MKNTLEKLKNKEYNLGIVNIYEIRERDYGNPYGHIKEFIKLSAKEKYEAHRVISPIAIELAGIEDIYSINDINGNTYIFDIFEDGDYRVIDMFIEKKRIKEVSNEKYFKKNS